VTPLCTPAPLAGSLVELNNRTEWFHDPDRPPDNGPFVVVVDDFYHDPGEIRRIALSKPFFQYHPPIPDQVGIKPPSLPVWNHAGFPPPWSGTSIWRHKDTGKCIASPGIRYYRSDVLDHFQLALLVENHYNFLVLFQENVLHRVETGFGTGKGARLAVSSASEPTTESAL
jgi:hypothetical protein